MRPDASVELAESLEDVVGAEDTAVVEAEAEASRGWARRRFWLGIAAGLLLAFFLALALDAWLDGDQRSGLSFPEASAQTLPS